jgi:hypothetical protein
MNGCSKETTPAERQALVDLYTSTNGDFWIHNEQWLKGDPCVNSWFGVECNKFGNVISLYFFENGLDGLLPDSIINLSNLIYFYIFNDNREYEYIINS